MNLAALEAAIRPLREALVGHAIYRELDSPAALRVFMESHVFAVWDFMSLLKALQRQLCPARVPWVPPRDLLGARLVNAIVLAEESDDDARGGFASHFELYRRAMLRFGADTSRIDELVDRLRRGEDVAAAIAAARLPPAAPRFVAQTFEVIASGDACRIAAAFTFGREDLLPAVFSRIVDRLGAVAGDGLDDFKFYLQRHVDLDGDEHGPMAQRLVAALCGADESRWLSATAAATAALESRLDLWNAIQAAARAGRNTPVMRP